MFLGLQAFQESLKTAKKLLKMTPDRLQEPVKKTACFWPLPAMRTATLPLPEMLTTTLPLPAMLTATLVSLARS